MEEGIYLFEVKEKLPKVDENISLIHQNLGLVQEDGPIPGGKKLESIISFNRRWISSHEKIAQGSWLTVLLTKKKLKDLRKNILTTGKNCLN